MMRMLLSLVLACTLFLGGSLLAADKPVKGTIVKIDKAGSDVVVVVSVAAKKKDAAAGNVEKQEKKFTIKADTKVEKVTGKKDSQTHTDAKVEDLKEGAAVTLTLNGDKVVKVEISGGKKPKK